MVDDDIITVWPVFFRGGFEQTLIALFTPDRTRSSQRLTQSGWNCNSENSACNSWKKPWIWVAVDLNPATCHRRVSFIPRRRTENIISKAHLPCLTCLFKSGAKKFKTSGAGQGRARGRMYVYLQCRYTRRHVCVHAYVFACVLPSSLHIPKWFIPI